MDFSASLTGLVTDVDGSPVVGARVAVGGNQAISQSNGSWQLFDLRGGYNRVTAQADVNGQTWSGKQPSMCRRASTTATSTSLSQTSDSTARSKDS